MQAIQEIKGNFASLNVKERQDLLIKVADILFAFPYQIGIFFDDGECFVLFYVRFDLIIT